jgi:hypothetical protein
VKNLFAFGLGVSAAAAILVLGLAAQAQDKKKEPAKKPPACISIKSQVACEARADCSWVTAVKDKDGKTIRRAYCRAKPKK